MQWRRKNPEPGDKKILRSHIMQAGEQCNIWVLRKATNNEFYFQRRFISGRKFYTIVYFLIRS